MTEKLPSAWRSWRSAIAKIRPEKRLTKLAEVGIGLRDARKALEAQAEALGKEERALKDYVIENFAASDLTEVRTKAGSMRLVTRTLPTIDKDDWPKLYDHIAETGEFDLLQRRLHEGACKERWENKKQIPGVKQFIKKDLKLGDAE